MKTNLTEKQLSDLKYLHRKGIQIRFLAQLFRIRTQRVTQICGRRRIEYDSKNNQT